MNVKVADMILVQDLPGGAQRHILVPMALTVDTLLGDVMAAFVLRQLPHGRKAFQDWAAQSPGCEEFSCELQLTEDGGFVAVYRMIREQRPADAAPEQRMSVRTTSPEGYAQVNLPSVAWLGGGPKGEA